MKDFAFDQSLIESHEKLREWKGAPYVGSEASLIWGIIFGAVGLAYFVFGKRQQRFVPLFCGIGLMAFPYFVSNTVLLVIVGLVLSAIPYFLGFEPQLMICRASFGDTALSLIQKFACPPVDLVSHGPR